MAWEAVFEFFAGNPPSIAIAGGILLLLMSAATAPLDASTTDTLRSGGFLLIILGFILQVLWLFRDRISEL